MLLRKRFSGTSLHPEDLLLLETFQIKYLPDRVAVKEFATLLHAYPVLFRFLVLKHPPIRSFLDRILNENKAVEPATSFRSFIKEKARKNSLKNLFVMDGTLDGIPLPDHSLDILITSYNPLNQLKIPFTKPLHHQHGTTPVFGTNTRKKSK